MAQQGYYDNGGNWIEPETPIPGLPDPYEGSYAAVTPGAGPATTTPPPGDTDPGTNIGPFNGRFQAPAMRGLPGLPGIPGAPIPNLPDYTPPPAWQSPSFEQAQKDPGYQFRVKQGEDSLQRWAAARGTLNDSGTANALTDYGQNSASQEYQNVWNREYTGYNTNVQNQYVDPYKFAYSAALDRNAPALQQWQAGIDNSRLGYTTAANWNQHANDTGYKNAWDQFMSDYDMWKDRRDNEQWSAIANPQP